jgi:hypothetical protein
VAIITKRRFSQIWLQIKYQTTNNRALWKKPSVSVFIFLGIYVCSQSGDRPQQDVEKVVLIPKRV